MIGGHYTYAEVPLGDWLQALTGGERNNYDKLGHFAQGFIPAIIAREVLIRHHVINSRAWLAFVVVSICLAFSAFYELLEWGAAVVSAEGAESFLGTQGYVWDTQSDMLWALCGALLALLALSAWHDRQIAGAESFRSLNLALGFDNSQDFEYLPGFLNHSQASDLLDSLWRELPLATI